MTSAARTAFVSGPITPAADYFGKYYRARIDEAIVAGDCFVVGPVPGIDTEALYYLAERIPANRITVYLANFEEELVRNDLEWFEDKGGNIHIEGLSTAERDAAMTRDSDYDILRYLTEEEAKEEYGKLYWPRVSNTQRNEMRRAASKLQKAEALSGEKPSGILNAQWEKIANVFKKQG